MSEPTDEPQDWPLRDYSARLRPPGRVDEPALGEPASVDALRDLTIAMSGMDEEVGRFMKVRVVSKDDAYAAVGVLHAGISEPDYLFELPRSLQKNKAYELEFYADADGTIAYWHGNFVPRRDPALDWTKPVDGSDPRTEWRGLHEASETITLKNPASGWIQNTNNSPWRAAGPSSAAG